MSAVAFTSSPAADALAAAAPAAAEALRADVVVWAGLVLGATIRSFSKIRAFSLSDEVETVKEVIKSKWPNDLERIDVPRIELRGGWATTHEAREKYASTVPLDGSNTLSEAITITPIPVRIFFIVDILPDILARQLRVYERRRALGEQLTVLPTNAAPKRSSLRSGTSVSTASASVESASPTHDSAIKSAVEKAAEKAAKKAAKDAEEARAQAAQFALKLRVLDYYGLRVNDATDTLSTTLARTMLDAADTPPRPMADATLAHIIPSTRAHEVPHYMKALGVGMGLMDDERNYLVLPKFAEIAFDAEALIYFPEKRDNVTLWPWHLDRLPPDEVDAVRALAGLQLSWPAQLASPNMPFMRLIAWRLISVTRLGRPPPRIEFVDIRMPPIASMWEAAKAASEDGRLLLDALAAAFEPHRPRDEDAEEDENADAAAGSVAEP